MATAARKTPLSALRRLEIHTRRLMNDRMLGEHHSVFKGRGMDFEEVREYVAGDEVRSIDWNVTARAGRPFVKKYTEERELNILVMLDVSASGAFGSAAQSKRELAQEIASILALSATRNSDKVGLLLFSDRLERYLPPRKGRTQVLKVVDEILNHAPQGRGTRCVEALDIANRRLSTRAVIFLLSDFQLPSESPAALAELERALRQTRVRHDLIAVRIEDPRERELPDLGVLTLEDAESGELIELDTSSPAVRKAYRERAREHAARILHTLRAAGADALELDTSTPYLAPLRRFLKSRDRRRA
jgi:uncharacterized protein (DUF58 family)